MIEGTGGHVASAAFIVEVMNKGARDRVHRVTEAVDTAISTLSSLGTSDELRRAAVVVVAEVPHLIIEVDAAATVLAHLGRAADALVISYITGLPGGMELSEALIEIDQAAATAFAAAVDVRAAAKGISEYLSTEKFDERVGEKLESLVDLMAEVLLQMPEAVSAAKRVVDTAKIMAQQKVFEYVCASVEKGGVEDIND